MTDARPSRRRLPRINPFVLAFFVGVATLTALRPLLRHIPEPPPVVGDVPPFTLVDQDGRPFGRNDLLGRVTIANVFCTRCGSWSAAIMKGLRRIEDAYRDRGIERIGFVSISVDPSVDTPTHLQDYARDLGASPGRWTFLTGGAGATHDLAAALFKNAPASGPEAGPNGPLENVEGGSPKPLVLIDQQGRIRGWYGADEMGLDEVYNRAQHVLAQSARRQP